MVGCGLSFTVGRGNELVRHAVDSLRFLVVGRFVEDIQGEENDVTAMTAIEAAFTFSIHVVPKVMLQLMISSRGYSQHDPTLYIYC